MNQWMDQSMDEWINKWMDESMNGWINEIQQYIKLWTQSIKRGRFWSSHQLFELHTHHWGRLGRPTHHIEADSGVLHITTHFNRNQHRNLHGTTSPLGAFFYLHGNFRKDVLNFLLSFNTIKSRIKSYLIPIFCDLNYFFLVIFRLLIS
jgi:hypothetical protein